MIFFSDAYTLVYDGYLGPHLSNKKNIEIFFRWENVNNVKQFVLYGHNPIQLNENNLAKNNIDIIKKLNALKTNSSLLVHLLNAAVVDHYNNFDRHIKKGLELILKNATDATVVNKTTNILLEIETDKNLMYLNYKQLLKSNFRKIQILNEIKKGGKCRRVFMA